MKYANCSKMKSWVSEMYLVAGDGECLEVEENEGEEADDHDDDGHLVVAEDADGEHHDSEGENDSSPNSESSLDFLNSIYHY